jgi:hypothetical protein
MLTLWMYLDMVLLEDWNVDVRGEKARKYMAELGMREVIM